METIGLHSITEANEEEKQGVCSLCGPTKLHKVSSNTCAKGYYWSCELRNKQKNERRKNRPRTKHQPAQTYSYSYDGGTLKLNTKQREAIIAKYSSTCAICNTITDNPQIDHCHRTGRIRGVLCTRHNTALGQFKDSTGDMRAAIAYLDRHDTTHVYEVEKIRDIV